MPSSTSKQHSLTLHSAGRANMHKTLAVPQFTSAREDHT
jgi:hypothetical protein